MKVVYIAETMEGQHDGLVLSVDALTKDCLHDILCHSSCPHSFNHLSAHIIILLVIDGDCILSELRHTFQDILLST